MIFCVDVDGVLTDGKIWVTHKGEISKGFNSRDLAAIRELISNGHQVHIVTASSWPGAESYMNKSGAEFHVLRNKEEIPFQYDVAIGDSAWDIPMLKKARYMFCPKDAQSEVRFLKDINILETKGGNGVMAEIVEIFIL
jgi:3-deoxy-D-manno-octulosonate 8-phosphate phosphatase (KDO 8-P phosphatase)